MTQQKQSVGEILTKLTQDLSESSDFVTDKNKASAQDKAGLSKYMYFEGYAAGLFDAAAMVGSVANEHNKRA